MNARILSAVIIAVAVPAVLGWIYRTASRQKAVSKEGKLNFPAAKAYVALMWFAAVFFCVLTVASPFMADSAWWITAIFLGFAIFAVLCAIGSVPTLTIDDEGISSAAWYSKKRVLWSQVAKLSFNPGKTTFTILGSNGKKIECGGFHVDAGRFREEVLRRTKLPLEVKTPGVWKMKSNEVSNEEALRLNSGAEAASVHK